MSLDFNLGKIQNYKKVCFERKRLRPVTEAIIWATISIGIREITEENHVEFFQRINFYEKTLGTFRQAKYGGPLYISLDDVKSHVGLSTNASTLTKAKFLSHLFKIHSRECAGRRS